MKKKNASARVALPASHKTAPKGAKLAGKISPDERLEVTVRLRRKPGAGAPKAGAEPLTREEFRAAYSADPADVEKVEEFANEHGLDIVQSSISQRAVRLSGTVAAMQTAFGCAPVGFITSKLYALKPSANALRDITGGDNGVNKMTGYKAKTGWDACTGLGSPHGLNLLAAF
jgi:hypothetical protein